jgi:hypothetical protein
LIGYGPDYLHMYRRAPSLSPDVILGAALALKDSANSFAISHAAYAAGDLDGRTRRSPTLCVVRPLN